MKCDENAEKYGYEGEMTPMKCDKLKAYVAGLDGILHENKCHGDVYLKDDVDEAIAELKEFAKDACLERDDNQTAIDELQAENAELKAKLEDVQASAYAESVDAGMRERRLRKALYKACAEWALSTIAWLDCIDQGNPIKWGEMRRKCLKKVEEYK